MHALAGDSGHRPGRENVLHRVEVEQRFLHRLSAHAGGCIFVFDHSGDRFERLLRPGGEQNRGAQLPHQDRGSAHWVVRQNADGLAVILDFTLDRVSIRKPDSGDQELGPACVAVCVPRSRCSGFSPILPVVMMRAASFRCRPAPKLMIKIAALVDTVAPSAVGIPCRLDRDQGRLVCGHPMPRADYRAEAAAQFGIFCD